MTREQHHNTSHSGLPVLLMAVGRRPRIPAAGKQSCVGKVTLATKIYFCIRPDTGTPYVNVRRHNCLRAFEFQTLCASLLVPRAQGCEQKNRKQGEHKIAQPRLGALDFPHFCYRCVGGSSCGQRCKSYPQSTQKSADKFCGRRRQNRKPNQFKDVSRTKMSAPSASTTSQPSRSPKKPITTCHFSPAPMSEHVGAGELGPLSRRLRLLASLLSRS